MSTLKLTSQTSFYKLNNILFYALVLALVFLYLVFQPAFISIDQAQNAITGQDSRVAAYIVSFIIMLVCALTPIPAEAIALANTVIYSPLEAFLVTWLSALLSAQAGYELGRLNCYDPCKVKAGNKICRWLTTYGIKALAIMRLIPLVPFFALNIGSGILKLNRYQYIVITAVTIIPAAALLTFFPQLFLN
jgi:uncharacterized membrane protein YdjX (TVP38/TMEM64 family)